MKSTLKQDINSNESSSKTKELHGIINGRIEKLRSKLLDMTRNNPLISTKFSER